MKHAPKLTPDSELLNDKNRILAEIRKNNFLMTELNLILNEKTQLKNEDPTTRGNPLYLNKDKNIVKKFAKFKSENILKIGSKYFDSFQTDEQLINSFRKAEGLPEVEFIDSSPIKPYKGSFQQGSFPESKAGNSDSGLKLMAGSQLKKKAIAEIKGNEFLMQKLEDIYRAKQLQKENSPNTRGNPAFSNDKKRIFNRFGIVY